MPKRSASASSSSSHQAHSSWNIAIMASTPTKRSALRLASGELGDANGQSPTDANGQPPTETQESSSTLSPTKTQGPPRTTQGPPRTPGAAAKRARGPTIPDEAPLVAMRLCVGDTVVPASADNSVDPFDRWVYRAAVGSSYSTLADRTPGASLRNLPTAVKLHRLAEAQRGPRQRLVRLTGADCLPISEYVSVNVDGVDVEVTTRKRLRMKATPEALTWLFGALRADLRLLLAAGVAATGRQPAADAADEFFTEEQIETMRAHQIKSYSYGKLGSRWLLAAPKSHLVDGVCLTNCPGRKRFRIRAFYDRTGNKRRKPRGQGAEEKIAAALRRGAARALSMACNYHNEVDAEDASLAGGQSSGPVPDADSAGSSPPQSSQPSGGGDGSSDVGP